MTTTRCTSLASLTSPLGEDEISWSTQSGSGQMVNNNPLKKTSYEKVPTKCIGTCPLRYGAGRVAHRVFRSHHHLDCDGERSGVHHSGCCGHRQLFPLGPAGASAHVVSRSRRRLRPLWLCATIVADAFLVCHRLYPVGLALRGGRHTILYALEHPSFRMPHSSCLLSSAGARTRCNALRDIISQG